MNVSEKTDPRDERTNEVTEDIKNTKTTPEREYPNDLALVPLREMVVFAQQNLLGDPPFSRMDLISCRNLMIYLEPSLQKQVVPTLHYALKPGGFLLLGASESVGTAGTGWASLGVSARWAACAEVEAAAVFIHSKAGSSVSWESSMFTSGCSSCLFSVTSIIH